MRKLLLLAVLTVFGLVDTNAQCTPDTSLAPGVYPDSATNFLPAYVNQPYEQIIQAVVPADTCIVVVSPPCQSVPFISVDVLSISGLPPNFTYDCVPSDCSFPGDSAGCVRIYSTLNPVMQDTGRYNLTIELDAIVDIGGFPVSNPTTVDYYFIDVLPPQGIEGNNIISGLYTWPNPAREYVQVSFSNTVDGLGVFKLTTLVGKEVYSSEFQSKNGIVKKKIDLSKLAAGVYLFTVQLDGHSLTRKLIVE